MSHGFSQFEINTEDVKVTVLSTEKQPLWMYPVEFPLAQHTFASLLAKHHTSIKSISPENYRREFVILN